MSVKVTRKKTISSKNLEKALKELNNNKNVGKVGWFKDNKYSGTNIKVATVAAIHEFGAPSKNIPPRPFFRPTIKKKEKYWSRIGENELKLLIKGKRNVDESLNAIGQVMEADVRETITQLKSPKLKESTIKGRLSKKGLNTTGDLKKAREYVKSINSKKNATYALGIDKPLVETGILLNTLTSRVVKK